MGFTFSLRRCPTFSWHRDSKTGFKVRRFYLFRSDRVL
jgi:hypothetical protein